MRLRKTMLLVASCGAKAEVDLADYPSLCGRTWFLTEKGYFATTLDGKKVRLHHLLTGVKGVDHKDRNKLNNRRSNLRKSGVCDNNQNRGRLKSNTTGFKGVSKNRARYAAVIDCQGKRKYLGLFNEPKQAALAYDRAAIELHGQFACTNAALGLV